MRSVLGQWQVCMPCNTVCIVVWWQVWWREWARVLSVPSRCAPMDKINYSALHASAAVSEVNGEVSCSVEETNKLRSALGLRPLNIGTSGSEPTAEEIAVRNWSAARQHDQSEKRLAAGNDG